MLKKWKIGKTLPLAVILTALFVANAQAGGVFSTDRFGYTGVVTRYNSLADAQNSTNAVDTVTIEDVAGNNTFEHRDASFYFVNDAGAYDTNYNVLMGSWWYSTDPLSSGAGWGNINGNTGIGFMQMYDANGSTDTSIDMGFSNFDGNYWTDYTLQVSGSNATAANDYARFSVYDNVHDAGTYLSYDLDITASGLEGVQVGDVITANNHPISVNGTFDGLFVFGGDSDGDIYTGYYTINLVFDMNNWSWDNRNSLTGPYDDFYDSLFVETGAPVVPVPAAAGLGFLGMGLVGFLRRRKNAAA